MSKELRIKRVFPLSREELFKYFTNPELIELWSYPDGMTLTVPQFDFKSGGRYRYEHSVPEGKYVCVGHFEKIIPNQKMEMVDEKINRPDGKAIMQNLKCTQIFRDSQMGTEVEVFQEGFQDEETLNECRIGWEQCFDHLRTLIDRELGSQIAI